MIVKKYILLSMATMLLAGCTGDDMNNAPADERLPLRLEATLSSNRALTRAYDDTFEESDVLLSYVQHVYKDGENNYNQVSGIQASLVKFSKDMKPETALYWDDFSNSSSTDTYLRTEGHGLRSFYGYCYNGGTPSAALVETTGVLGWTTTTDQSATGAFKQNDLLWSATLAPVTYNHAKDDHGTITVPYTHAMSKFTIVIKANEGFNAKDLEETVVTLKNMSEVGEFNAPTGTVTATGAVDVKMRPDADKEKLTRTFEAVTVPCTELTANNVLATIIGAGGNNYEIRVTDKMLEDASWGSGLKEGKTQSGYNYKLTVTINKQEVSVSASLANWNPVTATGVGTINFSNDVPSSGLGTTLNNGDKFTLWRAVKGTDELKEADLKESTTIEYNGTGFTCTPVLYWPNKDDSYYFRALATMTGSAISAVTEKTVSQGTDLLWGTTAKHGDYEANAAIAPRTGDVPLTFKHAMSKVVVNVETVTGDAAVVLTGATVTMTNIFKDGSINIASGVVTPTPGTTTDYTISGEMLMVPQTIDTNAKLIVTLKDGTTYSLALSGVSSITEWESGNQYNYTIKISKEEMKFSVSIKPWEKNDGSGNATLDWD